MDKCFVQESQITQQAYFRVFSLNIEGEKKNTRRRCFFVHNIQLLFYEFSRQKISTKSHLLIFYSSVTF